MELNNIFKDFNIIIDNNQLNDLNLKLKRYYFEQLLPEDEDIAKCNGCFIIYFDNGYGEPSGKCETCERSYCHYCYDTFCKNDSCKICKVKKKKKKTLKNI